MRAQTLLLLSASTVLFAACVDVAPDDPELGAAPSSLGGSGGRCSTCDDNGLPQPAWIAAPAQLGPAALGPAGLRLPDGTIRPLCATAPSPGVPCNLAPEWAAWQGTDTTRSVLLRYMIRVSARKVDGVVVPSWTSVGGTIVYGTLVVSGAFSLMPSALTVPWDERAQSIITAGMGLLVDANANGVGVCLKTETTPDCPPSYVYQELSMVGNLFGGRREVAIGGHAADVPELSKRVCPLSGPCNTYSFRAWYGAATCAYAGTAPFRYPTACIDPAGGPPFDYPVQVFMEDNPLRFGSSPYPGAFL